ncbi:MAG: phage tail family protein [Tetragenococcus halophilus]|nr:phage tail family protein [Tetragenococcus halophilus]
MDKNGITMTVNDEDLSPYLVINKLSRPSYDVENTVIERTSDGARVTNTKRNQRTISVEVTLVSDEENESRPVQEIDEIIRNKLDTKGDLRIVFSDFPDRYWICRLDGSSGPDIMTRGIATQTYDFLSPDGLAHSLESKEFEITEQDDERIFHIVNNGTAPARVNFNLEATRDVDSFALIIEDDENTGQGQVLQIGDEDDPEITEQEPQTYLWKTKMNSKQEGNWQDNIATPNYFSNSNNSDKQSRIEGSISWTRSDGVRAREYGGWNDGDNGYWHGPSITRFTKQDVQDFILYTRFHMRVTPLSLKGKKRTKKGGIMEFNVRDNDDNLICGVHFRDNDDKKEVIWLQVYLADVKVWDGKVPRAKLMQDKRFAGGLTIQRNGNKFYIEIVKNRNGKQHWKKTLSMNNEAAARLAATRVDYWFAKYGGREQLAMDVTRSNFKILNTEDEADIPNHIDEEDEVLIDGIESKVYINEEHRPEYFIVGSDFIEVPPGETDIYVVDDGALTGTASIEEVYV